MNDFRLGDVISLSITGMWGLTLTYLCVFPDVHGLHPHGALGQEAEPEPSGEGARAREGHGQHQRPQGPRPPEERQEVLLRGGGASVRRRGPDPPGPGSLSTDELEEHADEV